MKISRFIYKHHLLPPMVTPFRNLTDFMQIMYPEEYERLRMLKQRKEHFSRKQNQMIKVNQTIREQLYLYRNKYVVPLEKCPTFYEVLNAEIVRRLEKEKEGTYLEMAKRVSRRMTHLRFMSLYKAYKRDVGSDKFQELVLIPTFIYLSPQDIAGQKNWNALSAQVKESYEIQYLEYLQKYDRELKQIAKDQNIGYQELLRLMKNQYETAGERNAVETIIA